MPVDSKTGLIQEAPFHQSPHFDERPSQEAIDLIVIHGISLPPNQFDHNINYIDQFFLGKLNSNDHPFFETIKILKTAAHVVIFRDGSVIQYVPFTKRAWHAGVSEFQGRKNCNDFSIGIELEGSDTVPYEKSQYETLTKLVAELMKVYFIPFENIVGHEHIAPGRKTDPGPCFDWDYFRRYLVGPEIFK